jgi:hypothetical protein
MENFLKTIIKDRKAEELAKLNAITVVENLFNELLDRERDILTRRFGLNGKGGETLEEIGQAHNLTRERVRQIESASIKKIKKLENLETQIDLIKQSVNRLLAEHGGLMEQDFLLDILSVLSVNIGALTPAERELYKKHCDFVISELLQNDVEKVEKSDNFSTFYKLKNLDINHLEEVVKELGQKISGVKQTLTTAELLDILRGLKAYTRHGDKLKGGKELDLTDILKDEIFSSEAGLLNAEKVQHTLLKASKNIKQNKFGNWGLEEWPEIKPKKISDKIYLVLKHHGEPMHFTDIAKEINVACFDKKKANPGTVHNELILDQRYVLTDRGRYGLREWKK